MYANNFNSLDSRSLSNMFLNLHLEYLWTDGDSNCKVGEEKIIYLPLKKFNSPKHIGHI